MSARAMKDSGVPWIGEIPVGWDVVRLSRISTAYCDGPFGSGLKSEHYVENGVRVIRLQNVGRGGFDARDAAYVSFEHARSLARHEARPGDLILAGLGDENHPVGRACMVPDSIGPAIVKADCFRFRIDARRALAGFVCWYLSSEVAASESGVEARGATRIRINLGDAARIRVPLPTLAEQQRIVDFLDARTAAIDAALREHENTLKLLAERRAAAVSRAVTRGIDPNAPLRESGVAWIGDVPSHWRTARIVCVAKLESGHTPSRSEPTYWVPSECTIPWFSLADVWQLRDGRQEYLGETAEKISAAGLANSSARLLPAGTVVLSRTASVGFSGIMPVPMATTQDFANWVCGSLLVPEYLLYLLRAMSGEFSRMMQGSTHQTIYMPDLKKLAIPLPPLDEQRAIVAYIRARTAEIDAAADTARRAMELLREYRRSLVNAAVTGRVAPEALLA